MRDHLRSWHLTLVQMLVKSRTKCWLQISVAPNEQTSEDLRNHNRNASAENSRITQTNGRDNGGPTESRTRNAGFKVLSAMRLFGVETAPLRGQCLAGEIPQVQQQGPVDRQGGIFHKTEGQICFRPENSWMKESSHIETKAE